MESRQARNSPAPLFNDQENSILAQWIRGDLDANDPAAVAIVAKAPEAIANVLYDLRFAD
jgi:hypothetical protein